VEAAGESRVEAEVAENHAGLVVVRVDYILEVVVPGEGSADQAEVHPIAAVAPVEIGLGETVAVVDLPTLCQVEVAEGDRTAVAGHPGDSSQTY